MMTFGEVFSFFLSFCRILMSSIIVHILIKYYDSINFTQRNTVTYLSLHLIYTCYASVLTLVRVINSLLFFSSKLELYFYFYVSQNLSIMVFILFGSVNYAIAVIVRTLYFSLIFMIEATVIIILIIRQVIILKVIQVLFLLCQDLKN